MNKKSNNKNKPNKPVNEDVQFVREVNEEIKQARLVSLFKDNIILLVTLVIIIVSIVGGRQIYLSYISEKTNNLSNQFANLTNYYQLSLKEKPNQIKQEALEKLVDEIDNSGYRALLLYKLAHTYTEKNRINDAYTTYEKTFNNKFATKELRAMARIRAGFILLGVDHDKVKKAIGGLANTDGSKFKNIASEILATSFLYIKDYGAASSLFQSIADDVDTDAATRQRIDNLKLLATLEYDLSSNQSTVDYQKLLKDFTKPSDKVSSDKDNIKNKKNKPTVNHKDNKTKDHKDNKTKDHKDNKTKD